jgi:two-component system phosphate regulon sensor histidine kinase PhoR
MQAVDELGRQRDVSVTMALDPEVEVIADSGGLDQMVLNLLDNAVKYTQDGGSVELRARDEGATVRIEVEDDGPGIDPRYRDRVFERFYRVDRGRSREAGGTGLGLAIVKHLADAMDGEVGLEPGAERGSVFWVRLPVASA